MCGILLLIENTSNETTSDSSLQARQYRLQKILQLIDNRGPEFQSSLNCVEYINDKNLCLFAKAAVLSFRSLSVQMQPISCEQTKNVLLFNGQIFSYFDDSANDFIDFDELTTNFENSDVVFLFKKLNKCHSSEQIVNVISKIRGPFSVIFWLSKTKTLFYGRDIFGRRSLCIGRDSCTGKPYIISSVGSKKLFNNPNVVWSEVEANGIYVLNFSNNSHELTTDFYKWNMNTLFCLCNRQHSCVYSKELPAVTIESPVKIKLNASESSSDAFIDSEESLLAEFESVLLRAVRRRVLNRRIACLNCRKLATRDDTCDKCLHSTVAIGFSGGIDSTLLAYLTSQVIDSRQTIDLLNVCFKFDAPDRLSGLEALFELAELCPSRAWNFVCCDVSAEELAVEREARIRHLIAPNKTVIDDSLGCALWFAARGVGSALTSSPTISGQRQTFVLNNTTNIEPVIDGVTNRLFDLAKIIDKSRDKNDARYVSPASIMLTGLGIDEQLGGYSSHRKAWRESKVDGVNSEICKQMLRIGSRNLGRDDRVCASFGRDMRVVFLDEELVGFLNSLPLRNKVDFEAHGELNSKTLLRKLALRLGFKKTSLRVKRAMQFGTRIAKLESQTEKGSDECLRL